MQTILVLGATSAIAIETARCYAAQGATLLLVGRKLPRLDSIAEDLRTRGASRVEVRQQDLTLESEHDELVEWAWSSHPRIDVTVIAYGSLGDQTACARNYEQAKVELTTNFISVVSLLTRLADRYEQQKQGTIAVISSVAGDRGRQSNYVYGAAKGGLSIYLQGLRNRLFKSHVNVLTVKPGFVDTPMTAQIKKGPLFVTPDVVGRAIHKGIANKKDTIYTPGFWRLIMGVILSIPESIFKRLSL